jgi:hypothetical protein
MPVNEQLALPFNPKKCTRRRNGKRRAVAINPTLNRKKDEPYGMPYYETGG